MKRMRKELKQVMALVLVLLLAVSGMDLPAFTAYAAEADSKTAGEAGEEGEQEETEEEVYRAEVNTGSAILPVNETGNNVASITKTEENGTTTTINYTDFSQALENWEDGTTLTLLADISSDTLGKNIEILKKSVSLDLHGYTLDMSKEAGGETSWFSFAVGDNNSSMGEAKGTLKIYDSTEDQKGKVLGKVEVKDKSTFTMESGEIESSSGEGIKNEGTTTVSGGKVSGTTIGINNQASLTVNGAAEITGIQAYAINNGSEATMTISGSPTLTGGQMELYLASKITINTQLENATPWRVQIQNANGVFAVPGEGITLNSSWFTAVNDGYEVKKNENGELVLCNHTTTAYETNTVGDTLSEICSVCKDTYGSIAIAVEGGTYTGTAFEAEVTKTGTLAEEETADIVYKRDENALLEAPVDAGTYTAELTFNEYTIQKAFTIAPVEPTIVGKVTAKRKHDTDTTIYSSTKPEDVELTGTVEGVALSEGGKEAVGGTFKLADTVTELKTGTNAYAYVFTPDSSNYKKVEGTVSVTAIENTVTGIAVTKEPTKKTYTYGEKLDLSGAVITASYADGTKKEVTDKVTFADAILEKTQTEVEVSYTEGGKTVTAEITGIVVNDKNNGTTGGSNMSGSGSSSGGNTTGSGSGGGSSSGGNSTGSGSGGGSSSGGNSTGSGSNGGGNTNGAGSAAQTTTKTETKEDGSAVTTTETKREDGTVITKTETKNPDGSAVTKTETKNPDGSAVTKTETKKTDGSAVTTTETKNADGSSTTETVMQNAGSTLEAQTETVIRTEKDKNGTITKTEVAVTQVVDGKSVSLSKAAMEEIQKTAGSDKADVVIKLTDKDGKTVCKVHMEAGALKAGESYKVLKLNKETGELTLINTTTYKADKDGNLILDDLKKANYKLVTEEEAAAYSKQVLKTVKPKNTKKTLTTGKKTKFELSGSLNMENVKKITYKSSDPSVATVNKNGTITAKKSGKVTVKATITLKNGKKKTVKMTIVVKAEK